MTTTRFARPSGLAAALLVSLAITGCPPGDRDGGAGPASTRTSPDGAGGARAGDGSASGATEADPDAMDGAPRTDAGDRGADVLMPGNGGGGATTEQASPRGALDDAAVLGVARALNKGEVDQAQAVQGRLKEAKAKDFAALMLEDHGAALEKVATLEKDLGVTAKESPAKERVERDGNAILERLKGAPAADLDRTYLESQVTLHRSALSLLDDQLIPAAKDQRLKAALTEMRGHVAHHLGVAEEATGQRGGDQPAGAHPGH